MDLPGVLNLNARSLSMETIDELEVIITDFNVSIACVTETWFKQYIDDDRIVIGGFNCERKDRLNKRAGGVVCYLRNSMVYTRMVELEDQTLEVLWLKIMPKETTSAVFLYCTGMHLPPTRSKF